MKAIIVTNCTNRKRSSLGESVQFPSKRRNEHLSEFALRWLKTMQSHPMKVNPQNLYCGRGYNEALESAKLIDAEILTVSAGFGLLRSDDLIPPYNFSIADLSSIGVTPEAWWSTITQARSIPNTLNRILTDESVDLLIISVSKNYFRFIEKELENAESRGLKKIRIITGSPPKGKYESNSIIYDSRLDGPDSPIRGTQADFNSRALRHFVENILLKRESLSIEVQQKEVNELLAKMRMPEIPKRKKATDREILELINMFWDVSGGKSAVTLRLLRDQAGVACEQGRFAQLFREVKRNNES